ncbi:S-adenosyl-L-methionine-dependent methyltransferase [Venturia nashicola]|uniref:sphingolipid C(9)-methyltransferase n=1 Tax=Venturia nashicola TaxID=86259 RepID=A0A4Z1PX22_9PEZI|nr:S-adenosyl-L-methionine-dependent methyltransferase [Venturia nashicola]
MAEKQSVISEESFEYIETPAARPEQVPVEDCGVRTTKYAAIKNAPLPADGPGADHFNNYALVALLAGVPWYLKRMVGGGWKTYIFFFLLTGLPVLATFWMCTSSFSPRKNEKAKLPGKPIEHYLTFHKEEDREKYYGRNKIPMETFHEKYFAGEVDFKGDCLEVLEYRHDWSSFRFTISLMWFFVTGMIPEVILHSRSQDEEQVRDHYDRGDDFYGWFLGPRMIYTSGIISDINKEESLEQLQDNKLAVVCEKIELKKDERMLDIGCGWGTLTKYASVNYGASVTGITLGRNQTAWGNSGLERNGISKEQSRILCMDYRDIPVPEGKYNKITCLEMAEHVGVRKFGSFCQQVNDMLEDDGVFFLQIAGLRKPWQYEDFTWGLFMNKYVFPGADASTPLGFFVDKLEGAGFEIKQIDTIGVHYSATLWKWYRNWMGNQDKVVAKYGKRWFRIWEYFLAFSTIASRQGTATCYQITLVKNINSTHRVEGIKSQYALSGALAAAQEGMFQRNDDEPSGKETQTSGDEDLWFTKPPPESTDMPENMNNEAMGKGEERDQVMPSARGTMEWEIARKKRSSSRLLLLRHPAIESKVLATERLRRPRPSQRLRCFNRIEDGSAGDG